MNIPLPSLRQLRYLVALADAGHFGRAASACHVTQPTLSAGLRELEATLGGGLIERHRRRSLFTAKGRKVLAEARDVLERAERLVENARQNDAPLVGPLRLGMIPTIAPYLVPGLARMLARDFPRLRLTLVEDLTDRLLDRLQRGSLDAVVIALPHDVPGVRFASFAEDRFWLICRRDHRLAQRRRVGVADLADEPLLLLTEGHCLRAQALAACEIKTTALRDAFEATSLATAVQMVHLGFGATLVPDLALDVLTGDPGLAQVRLDGPRAARVLALGWRSASGRGGDFARLAGMLGDLVAARRGARRGVPLRS